MIDYRRIPFDATATKRWTDRVQWEGNLFGAWQEIFPRLSRNLPVPFRLRGPQRIDQPVGVEALREALVNLLVHTDYQESRDAVILHGDDGYTFRNPGVSWVDLRDLRLHGRSDRRNPELAKMFDHIGLADRAGSGFIRILDEWRELGFREPTIESDPVTYEFELRLKLSSMMSADDRAWLTRIGGPWREEEELALLFARHGGSVDNLTLRTTSGQHLFDASKTLGSLRHRNYLVLEGHGKNALYRLGTAASSSGSERANAEREHAHEPVSTDNERASTEPLKDDMIYARLMSIVASLPANAKLDPAERGDIILKLCAVAPLSATEMTTLLSQHIQTMRRDLRGLVDSGQLETTQASKQHPGQRYRTVPKSSTTETQATLPLDGVQGAR